MFSDGQTIGISQQKGVKVIWSKSREQYVALLCSEGHVSSTLGLSPLDPLAGRITVNQI